MIDKWISVYFQKVVDVNGSPLYETSKYLLAVLTNWEITSSASYYQASEQYYWTSTVAGDTHVCCQRHRLPIVVKYIDRYVSYVT